MSLLQISSGRGPAEVRAFVRLLGEHLAAELGAPVTWAGDAAAPLSATLEVAHAEALPWTGTHLLLAPLRGNGRRKRWFVDVRLYEEPALAPPLAPVLRADRAGGPGGQNVNRRATAVRAVDPGSGLAVRVAEQRSQVRNRALALSRLEERHAARSQAALDEATADRRAAHDTIERGNPTHTWRLGAEGLVRHAP